MVTGADAKTGLYSMSDLSPSTANQRNPAEVPARPVSVKENVAFAFATQVATAAFTAILTLFLVRRLGPASYGLFALALSVGGLSILPADLGLSGSVARLIALERHCGSTLADIFADAIRLKVATTGLVSLLLFGLSGVIAGIYGNPSLAWPLRIVALSVFAESSLGMLTGIFVALGKVSVNFFLLLSESALEAGLSVVIVVLGGGAAGALAGRAAAYLFAFALGLIVAGRHVGAWGRQLRRRSAGHVRAIAAYASALALVEGSWVIFGRIDGLLIGGFLSTTQVGFFSAPLRLATFLSYPGYALAAGIAPTLARLQSARPATLMRGLRYLTLVQVAAVVPLIVWAEPMARLLLGARFGRSAAVLQAIAPFVFLSGFAPLLSLAVDYLGDARRRIPITLATVAINIVLDVILIPRLGIVGAAIGTDVAFAVYVPAHLWLCSRRIELDLRSLAATAGRVALAGGAAAAMLLVVGDHRLSFTAWVGGGALATAAFTATLLLTREVTIEELRDGRRLAWHGAATAVTLLRSSLRRPAGSGS